MVTFNDLKSINLLSELPDEVIAQIATLCVVRPYNKDEVIFEYNKKIDAIYMVLSGEINFFLPILNDEITIHVAKVGETFGISSILPDDYLTIFGAKGKTAGKLIEVNAKKLMEIFNHQKKVEYLFLLSALKAYNLKKVRQNLLLVKGLMAHRELKKIISS